MLTDLSASLLLMSEATCGLWRQLLHVAATSKNAARRAARMLYSKPIQRLAGSAYTAGYTAKTGVTALYR